MTSDNQVSLDFLSSQDYDVSDAQALANLNNNEGRKVLARTLGDKLGTIIFTGSTHLVTDEHMGGLSRLSGYLVKPNLVMGYRNPESNDLMLFSLETPRGERASLTFNAKNLASVAFTREKGADILLYHKAESDERSFELATHNGEFSNLAEILSKLNAKGFVRRGEARVYTHEPVIYLPNSKIKLFPQELGSW